MIASRDRTTSGQAAFTFLKILRVSASREVTMEEKFSLPIFITQGAAVPASVLLKVRGSVDRTSCLTNSGTIETKKLQFFFAVHKANCHANISFTCLLVAVVKTFTV